MDWKAFIASLVGSTAWPFVALVLIFSLRKHLGPLAQRLDELTLPGGAKAKFGKALDAARQQSEQIVIEVDPEQAKIETPKPILNAPEFLDLSDKYPETAIVMAFKEVEAVANEYNNIFDNSKLRINEIIDDLHRRSLLDDAGIELFKKLRSARNSAVHSVKFAITAGEAVEYRTLCEKMIRLLAVSFFELRQQLPPRP